MMSTARDMNFEHALDVLIATSITCLRNRDSKLNRAIEIAIQYRELSPNTRAPAISAAQLEALQKMVGANGSRR